MKCHRYIVDIVHPDRQLVPACGTVVEFNWQVASAQVFSLLPAQAQCPICAAPHGDTTYGHASDEMISAVEVGLHLLAEDYANRREWRDADPHGTGNNPHVWLPCEPVWQSDASGSLVLRQRQCPCGRYETSWPGVDHWIACHDQRCEREDGHSGMHMSRTWDAQAGLEIVDEWGAKSTGGALLELGVRPSSEPRFAGRPIGDFMQMLQNMRDRED